MQKLYPFWSYIHSEEAVLGILNLCLFLASWYMEQFFLHSFQSSGLQSGKGTTNISSVLCCQDRVLLRSGVCTTFSAYILLICTWVIRKHLYLNAVIGRSQKQTGGCWSYNLSFRLPLVHGVILRKLLKSMGLIFLRAIIRSLWALAMLRCWLKFLAKRRCFHEEKLIFRFYCWTKKNWVPEKC